MKKIICITIALCLVFASVLPVYAEAWTSQQAYNTNLNVQNIYQYLRDFLLSYNDGTVSNWTFGDLYWEVHRLATWIAPVGSNDGSYETLWSVLMNIAIDTRSYLPHIPTIAQYIVNWMGENNTYLSQLRNSLSNSAYLIQGNPFDIQANAHLQLIDSTNRGYGVYRATDGGNIANDIINWTYGSPIGNLALILDYMNNNMSNQYHYRWVADLKHYNDNLTTWDSQGSTLTQVGFTPESAIQGLYRYLAFTQRDVARLAYVFANDEELEARELAQANQEQVLDDFIDPDGSGSVSPTDIGNMTDASDGFKSNFSTNVGSSHIWDVFDNSRYNWFTQQTKNQLDTTQQTRLLKAVQDDYPTPLLDNYYNEIFGIIGVDIND